jgi:molybdopterin converting factor small subunit
MKIHFFGKIGERIGRTVELDVPPTVARVAELRAFLATVYPQAAADLASGASRACVGDTVVGEDQRIAPGDTVEFFPPLSGG